MNNKTIIKFGFASYEKLWRSRRVLFVETVTTPRLLDLRNSS